MTHFQRPTTLWGTKLNKSVIMKSATVSVNDWGEEVVSYTPTATFNARIASISFVLQMELQNENGKDVVKLLTGPYELEDDAHYELDGKDYRLIERECNTHRFDSHTILYLEEV